MAIDLQSSDRTNCIHIAAAAVIDSSDRLVAFGFSLVQTAISLCEEIAG